MTAEWLSARCVANGIHYLRTGGRKPPLLLLHGLTGSGHCWIPLARAIQDEYDVVMPDSRGHGGSSACSAGYDYHELASDVAGLINELGLERPVLLGHSMGGMTAAVLAARVGHAIRGVILADPTFLEPQRQLEVHRSDVAEQHRRALSRPKEDLVAEARARHPARHAELIEWMVTAKLRTHPRAWEILRPPNPDFRALVGHIEVPLLLVLADGGVVSLQTAQALQGLNPRLRIEQIRDAGHALHYDQPACFEVAARAFLRPLFADSLTPSSTLAAEPDPAK